MLAWRDSGFSVHNGVRVRARDAEGRKKLAQYMLRVPPPDGKGIDGLKPAVQESTYHPVPDIA